MRNDLITMKDLTHLQLLYVRPATAYWSATYSFLYNLLVAMLLFLFSHTGYVSDVASLGSSSYDRRLRGRHARGGSPDSG